MSKKNNNTDEVKETEYEVDVDNNEDEELTDEEYEVESENDSCEECEESDKNNTKEKGE